MTDIQAFEAWAKDKPLEVFWSWEAWKAATAAERERCAVLCESKAVTQGTRRGILMTVADAIRTGGQP